MRAAILLVPVLALAACSRGADARESEGEPETSGVKISRNYQVGTFDKVVLRGSHDVVVAVGGAPSVRAEGDSKAIERLEIEVDGDRLVIGSKRKNGWFNVSSNRTRVVVHVTVPSLAGAAVEGSGDIRVDKVQGDEFKGSIAGSGDLEIGEVRVKNASFSIAGSGGMRARGASERAEVSIAGSGDVDLSGLQSKAAKISVAGSGDVRAHASDQAEVSVMGSGDVELAGNPKCSISKMGSGDVRCGG